MANEQANEAPKKKSKLKIILLIIILLLIAVGGAGGFWWFQLRTPTDSMEMASSAGTMPGKTMTDAGMSTPTADATSTTAGTSTNANMQNESAKPKTVVNLVNIPTVTVNLADTDPIRYLKIGMDVEVNTSEAVQALNRQVARVRDSIIIVLSGKTYRELSTTAGKLAIKNEISIRLNQILGAPRVVQIYFTEFVVQ